MQTPNEQLVEALEILLRAHGSLGKDEPVWVLDPAFDIAADALDRYRNYPETLLKELGKARRELGERVRK